MGLRTPADVEEEYNSARDALLKAQKAYSHALSTGDTSTTVTYQRIEALRKEVGALAKEHAELSGGGLRVTRIVPSDE